MSQLNCFWKNVEKDGKPCVPPMTLVGSVGHVNADTFTSYASQGEANRLAEDLAISLTICASPDQIGGGSGSAAYDIPLSSPFGVSASVDSCCRLKVEAGFDSVLWSPGGAGSPGGGAGGWTKITPAPDTSNSCSNANPYFYLEAINVVYDPSRADYARWYSANAQVKMYPGRMSERDGNWPSFSVVRRLIASASGIDAKCGDLSILQSVTCEQKIGIDYQTTDTTGSGAVPVPVIVDFNSSTIPPVRLHPFQVTAGANLAAKFAKGRLIKSIPDPSEIAITGMDSNASLAVGNCYWLSLAINPDFSVASAIIDSGTGWPANMAEFDDSSPPAQTKAVIRIGEAANGVLPDGIPGFQYLNGVTVYHFKQYLHTNLVMTAVVYNGQAAVMPVPWGG
jgi:hypothetical protein